ncbi:MAG: P-loop NTPase [Candidatus Dormibacteria bacterium]|jgi:pilus assembly protein CpaE
MQEGSSGSATRVLIASDATYAVARLETLAGYSDRVILVGFSRETSELGEDIRLLRPDVLLLHQGFGRLDIVSLVDELARNVPGLGVVVVLDAADPALTARLAQAGAATMVADNAEGPDLIAAIDRAVSVMAPPAVADLSAPPPLSWAPEPGPSAPAEAPPGSAQPAQPEAAPWAAQPEPAPWGAPPDAAQVAPYEVQPSAPAPARWELEIPPDAVLTPEAAPEASPSQPTSEDTAEDTAATPSQPARTEPPPWEHEASPGPAEAPAVPAGQEPTAQPGVPVFQLDDETLGSPTPLEVPETPLLDRTPEQVARPRTARRGTKGHAELFVVFSGKGGVGKSVIATNLAVALSAKGNKVAIVDLDLQFGDVAVMLHAENHPTAIDALAQQGEQVEIDFIEEVMATGPEGVRALLAPTSPEFADLVNTANLRAILRELATTYDQIIVDTPAHLEERNLEAIETADQIIVVTNFNITAIKDTKVTLKLLQSLGIPKERIALVLNQTRAKASFPRAEVDDSLRFPVVASLPFEPRIDEFIDAGKTIVSADAKCDFSKQIRQLVDHLSPAVKAAPQGARGERAGSGSNRRRFSLGRS